MTSSGRNPDSSVITTPTRHSLIFGLLAAGLVLTWLILQGEQIGSRLAQNAGFIVLNHAYAVAPNAVTNETTRRAIYFLERATTGDRVSPSTWRALGYLYLIRGAEEEALTAWRHTETMQAELLAQGAAAEDAGDLEEALRWFLRAVRLDPSDPEAWLRTGLIHESRGELSDAMTFYETGSRVASNNGDLLYRQGRLISRKPAPVDWATVLELADRAITGGNFLYDWSEVQSHVLRADGLRQLGREAEALTEYAWVVEHRPDEYWASVHYGELKWQVEGDLNNSVMILKRAIELDSANKWAYLALGRVYDAAGRRDEAARYFDRVLAIDPSDRTANAWFEQ